LDIPGTREYDFFAVRGNFRCCGWHGGARDVSHNGWDSGLRGPFLAVWQFGGVRNAVFVFDKFPMSIQADVFGAIWKWPSRRDDDLSPTTEVSIDSRREIHFAVVRHIYFIVQNSQNRPISKRFKIH
jgi:hypothetical protein